MAHVDRLTVYPVKALDGVDRQTATVLDGGTLAADREFAVLDADGEPINGKRTDRVHDVEATVDPETGTLTVGTGDGGRRTFELRNPTGRERAAAWFGEFFGREVSVVRDASRGHVDRPSMGPSVVSTATLEAVASWFDELTVDGVRRRLRANVEVGGVPAFWEDRFVGADAPAFRVGDVRFEGVTPCGRCVVPERDPDTGERDADFREWFVARRRETFPDWADEAAFDHHYTVMLIARVPERDRGKPVRVGDDVTVLPG